MENQKSALDVFLEEIIPDEQARLKLRELLGPALPENDIKSIKISTPRSVIDVPALVKEVCQVIKEEFPADAMTGVSPAQIVERMIRVNISVDAVKESSKSVELPVERAGDKGGA